MRGAVGRCAADHALPRRLRSYDPVRNRAVLVDDGAEISIDTELLEECAAAVGRQVQVLGEVSPLLEVRGVPGAPKGRHVPTRGRHRRFAPALFA